MSKRKLDRVEALRKSAVKLFTVIKQPNYYQPWDLGYQNTSGGSGCILEGHRILTNAHVVSDQVYVQVLRTGATKKYDAKVEYVDHGSETALLTVADPSFFEDSVPVRFGDLPVRQDRVAVYGFPIGGDELCITEGIVSRIEVRTYTHSQRDLLSIQTDAAINPGNSGGPVFKNGNLAGIAFESYSGQGVENTGYVVPIPVIRRFLDDVRGGVSKGVPDLGVYWQNMESDSLREFHRMKPHQTGVLVTKVVYGSSAWGVLEGNDVLVTVDGTPVANDGSVPLRRDDRVNFSHLVSQHQIGDEIEVGILRKGRLRHVRVALLSPKSLVPRPCYDVRPTYFIFAGVLFMPLTYNFMRMWDWKDVEPRFRFYYGEGLPTARRREIVIINQVLAHEINVGYHKLRNAVVERVNGKPIREMRNVIGALKKPLGRHHVIELDNHAGWGTPSDGTLRVVIDARAADGATAEVLARYGIPRDRSKDLEA